MHDRLEVRTREVHHFVNALSDLAVGVLKGDQLISLQQEIADGGRLARHGAAKKIVHPGSPQHETPLGGVA